MSGPTDAERDAAADRYRTVGPYHVLGCLDAELTEARRTGNSPLVSSLLLAQAAIDDLIAHKETAEQAERDADIRRIVGAARGPIATGGDL